MASNSHEIYRGSAIIMGISIEGAEDWKEWERNKLSDADKQNAFKLVYDVAEGNAQGARHDVKIEVSHRELVGKMLEFNRREDGATPTQIDVAIKMLVQQGIMPHGAKEGDLAAAVDDALVGKAVTIRVTEDPKDGGGYWPSKAFFCSKYQRITGAARNDRISAFQSGRPAQRQSVVTYVPPAPAEDDASDMPF